MRRGPPQRSWTAFKKPGASFLTFTAYWQRALPPLRPTVLWGIAEKTTLTPQERNIVYLAIIYENECTYCMAGHTNLSRMAKVDNDAIAAVREGRAIADSKLEALRQFAAKMTRQRGFVSEADVTSFKAAGYDNRAVLDLLVLAATKLISNYTNHLAQTPNDPFMKGAEWTAPGKLKPAA
jgi:AhpD family alkylhydroperoxidase